MPVYGFGQNKVAFLNPDLAFHQNGRNWDA